MNKAYRRLAVAWFIWDHILLLRWWLDDVNHPPRPPVQIAIMATFWLLKVAAQGGLFFGLRWAVLTLGIVAGLNSFILPSAAIRMVSATPLQIADGFVNLAIFIFLLRSVLRQP